MSVEVVEELPRRKTINGELWSEVQRQAEANPNSWVLVDYPNKKVSMNGVASNINMGRIVALRGFRASVRDGKLYVRRSIA